MPTGYGQKPSEFHLGRCIGLLFYINLFNHFPPFMVAPNHGPNSCSIERQPAAGSPPGDPDKHLESLNNSMEASRSDQNLENAKVFFDQNTVV